MNHLDFDVTEVLDEPYENYGKFWVRVKGTCETNEVYENTLMFDTLQEALEVKMGSKPSFRTNFKG